MSLLLLLSSAASASEADALAISRNIQALHLPYGGILDPVFDHPTGFQVVNYTRCGDSALWTGFYLAAESFRYSATHSPDALANAQRALTGLQSLVEVTGNDALARCAFPANSPYVQSIQNEEAHNGIHTAGPNVWVGNTSRDEYTGALFGLGLAYDLVDDANLRAAAAALVTRLVQFLINHAWTVVLPDGSVSTTFLDRPDQQLAFLALAQHINAARFSSPYHDAQTLLRDLVGIPLALDTLSNSSYFKFNLDTVNLYTLGRLDDSSAYRSAYNILRRHTAGQQNAFFDLIDRALNGPDTARDSGSLLLLDQWLQRPRRDLNIDNRGKYPSCGDASAASAPIPVPNRVTTDFLWQRSPYQLANAGGDNLIEGAGIDYILPYWMGRALGVIAPDSVHEGSAASGASTLAPDGIASVFGATGSAITVKDSAAVSRPATLLNTSTNQVNFVVPAGTAPGTAAFIVTAPSGAQFTLSAEIRAVAPSLFTADASGTGPAAGAFTQVIGPRQNTSLAFSCSASGCTTVPIGLGLDTPTYLTLYGTGIRHAASVTATIGGLAVPVIYAGAQTQYAGLDQINLALPLSLRGLGPADLLITADGVASNPVRVNIR